MREGELAEVVIRDDKEGRGTKRVVKYRILKVYPYLCFASIAKQGIWSASGRGSSGSRGQQDETAACIYLGSVRYEMKKEIDIQKENIKKLFGLIKSNPDLPIVPMVDYEVVGGDEYARWMGAWGNSRIAEYIIGERLYYRDDKDFGEIEDLLSEEYGYDAFLKMDDETAKKIYAGMPWIKGIIVEIDLSI